MKKNKPFEVIVTKNKNRKTASHPDIVDIDQLAATLSAKTGRSVEISREFLEGFARILMQKLETDGEYLLQSNEESPGILFKYMELH